MSERTDLSVDPEALLALPGGERFEFVNGQLKERAEMGAQSDEIASLVSMALNNHVRPKSLGRVYGAQTGYQCFPHEPRRVRYPDTSFVAAGRLEGDRTPEGYITLAPDLAVEVISPNDLYEDVEEKVQDYFKAGVRLVWIVSPRSKTVLIRRPDGACAALNLDGELSGEHVLPGFVCKVADLFI